MENSYSAKANIKPLIDEAKEKYGERTLNLPGEEDELLRNRPLCYRPVLRLDEDLDVSLKKMEEMGRVLSSLPGIDCGVCGAPKLQSLCRRYRKGSGDRAGVHFIHC